MGLDGEMVALEGQFYQVLHDGSVHPVHNQQKAPFAAVVPFCCRFRVPSF